MDVMLNMIEVIFDDAISCTLYVFSSSPSTIECDTPPNSVDVMLNMIEVIFDDAILYIVCFQL